MTNRSSLVERSFPQLSRHGKRDMVFTQTEYICDIYGQPNYQANFWKINPGLSESTFPYLCGFAQNFEEYTFLELEYFFKPFTLDVRVSSNAAEGWVGMVWDPNASDNQAVTTASGTVNLSSYLNKQQFLNTDGIVSGKTSYPLALKVDCKKHGMYSRYIRQGYSPGDSNMMDFGMLVFASGSQPNDYMIGELYVRYKVRFTRSSISYSLANSYRMCHYQCSGTINSSNMFGTVQTIQPGSNIGLQFSSGFSAVGSSFALPEFPINTNFMLVYYQTGTSGATWTFGTPVYINCAAANILVGDSVNSTNTLASGSSVYMPLVLFFTTTGTQVNGQSGNTAAIQFTASLVTATVTPLTVDLFVFQYPSALTT